MQRPTDKLVSKLTVSSSETFALGLIALELGLMTPLADRVCNASNRQFDSDYLEDSFTAFSNRYANYPQLISVVHDLVGAKTSPRTDPDFLLNCQILQPADLIFYDMTPALPPPLPLPLPVVTEQINYARPEPTVVQPAPAIVRTAPTVVQTSPTMIRQAPTVVHQSPPPASSQIVHSTVIHTSKFETPTKSGINHYSPSRPDTTRVYSPPRQIYSETHRASPISDGRKSLILADPTHPYYRKVSDPMSSPPRPDRSKSPILQNQRSPSPYRPLLSGSKSRSITPTKARNSIDLLHDSASANQRRKYVTKIDISTSQMAMLDTAH